jgi:hypothetical protein
VVWTINLSTGRGVLKGTAVLKSVPATGGEVQTTYSGPLTLITQGIPGNASGGDNDVPGRGFIDAKTYTNNAVDAGNLLANVEFEITPGFAAVGQFGDLNPSLGIPDYSVAFNNQPC